MRPLPDLADELKIELMTVQDHTLIVKTIFWKDEAATRDFAKSLASSRSIHDALIEMRGDLGAGKTTLVRHLLGALGVEGRIKSPTYAVVEPYTLERSALTPDGMAIWHFDFFRFNDPDEWEEAGFRDIFASPGLKLVEWPDKAGAGLPMPDLVIGIEAQPDESRIVTLTAHTDAGSRMIA